MMKAVLKFDLLIAVFLLMNLLIILSAMVAWADGKKGNKKEHGKEKSCGEIKFNSELISFEEAGSCYDVVLKVSFEEGVVYELSHANFDLGCGTYSEGHNSQGWPMVFNSKDPTTTLGGVKVDDIQNFGKDANLSEFEVTFRYCPDQNCDFSNLDVAYKAGQCIYNEQISVDIPDDIDPNNGGDDASSGDDTGGSNDGGSNTGDCPNDPNDPNGGSGYEPPELAVTVDKIDPTCLNENGGAISLYVTGGVAPISILWNTGNSTNTLSNLSAGTYTYTVSDAAGNQLAGDVVLDNGLAINIETILTKPDCQNINNGAIELIVSGGTAPYKFKWNNGSTEQNLTNLYAYTYHVSITDASGCSAELYIPLFSETNIFVEADLVQPSCQDQTLGSIALTPSGGAEPYNYLWSNGQTTSSLVGLVDGEYDVVITDNNGCTYSRSYSFLTDIGIEPTATVSKTNCLDEAVGAIDLTINGGVEPFKVVWSNGVESEDLDGLTSGDYTATITDANGCQTTYRTTVVKDNINIAYNGINIPSCNGSEDGSINIAITNATEPFTISWIDGSTGNLISSNNEIKNLSTGTYEVSVIDAAGCTAQNTIQLPEPSLIQVGYQMNTDDCTGSQDIVLEVTGGSWEYTYLWSDGSTGDQLQNVNPGTYSVTVTDSKGCTASSDIIVDDFQSQELACLIDEVASDIGCGSTNNILTSPVSNALSYNWAVASTDGGWAITSDRNQGQIEFVAGSAGSQATVSLTVVYEGGCEVTCEKVISACIEVPKDNCCCNEPELENPDVVEVPDDVVSEPNNEGDLCGECEGGVSYLNLDYLGAGPVSIVVSGEIKGAKGKKGKKEKSTWEQVFATVNTGDILEIKTPDGAEKLGTRTYLTIDDGEPFEIHTSCSQDIEVGMVFGDYKVVDGASLKGGPFCDAVPSDDIVADNESSSDGSNPDQENSCGTCEGGVSYLNLDYLGDGPVSIVVSGEIKGAKGKKGKKEKSTWEQVFATVNTGDILEIKTPEGAEKLGTRTYLTIDDGEPFEIHTSCSQDIEVGMVFGDYKVVDGASLKGGPFCGSTSSDDTQVKNSSDDEGKEGEENSGTNENIEEEQKEVETPIAEGSCDCFYTDPIQITSTPEGFHYTLEVRSEDCRYDLSHLTIDIPDCYELTSYSNSMNWAMQLVSKDPTTGLGGLKVDNIPAFGKDEELTSFKIEFTLTSKDAQCLEDLRCFTPIIAYKASTCLYEEITQGECAEEEVLAETISTYPNPTTDYVKINMKNCDKRASYKAEVYDFRGKRVCSYFIDKGFKDEFIVDLKYKKQGLYLLQLTRQDGVRSKHKIVKL